MTGCICHPEYPKILVATVGRHGARDLLTCVWKYDNEEQHKFYYFSYQWGARKGSTRWKGLVARMGADEKCRHNFSHKTVSVETSLKIQGQM